MLEDSPLLVEATQHYGQGNLLDAEACCRLLLQETPQSHAAIHMLGIILIQLGKIFEGELLIRHSIDFVDAPATYRINYGRILSALNNHLAASNWLESACNLISNDAGLINDTGIAFKQAGELDKAQKYFEQATDIDSQNTEYLFNLATVHKNKNRLAIAIEMYEKILFLDAFHTESARYLASCLSSCGQVEASLNILKKLSQQHPDNVAIFDNLLLGLHYDAASDRKSLLDWHAEFNRRFCAPLIKYSFHLNQPDSTRRLRIGYVSGDLGDHVMRNFFEPVLANHNPEIMEIFCYHNGHDDDISEHYKTYNCHWRNIRQLNDDQAGQQLRNDRIDVLVDLSLHSGKNRLLLFARKPIPVQVTWMGYASTTGINAIDYRITDDYLDPNESPTFGPELPLHLGSNFICFQPPATSPAINSLPFKSNGCLTFGSLNRQNKLNKTVLELWARLLAAIPHSRLLIVDLADPQRMQQTYEIFTAHGVDNNRIETLPKISFEDFLALHHRIDICLDPFPYTGGVTTLHSLWMGVPVITLTGSLPIQRFGGMLLKNVGLSEFIANSPEQYIDIARTINIDRLIDIRRELRSRLEHSNLTNARQFTRNLETVYRNIWQRWCESGLERQVLHVGCGPKNERTLHSTFKEAGWQEIRFDIDPMCAPDIVGSILNMEAIANQSMDAIWSSHNIEHLMPHEVAVALKEFFRVLKPGGVLLLALPDLQRVASNVANDLLEEPAYDSPAGPIAPIDMIYGHRPSLAEGQHYMAHRTGFTARTLREHLQTAGFIEVQIEQVRRYDLLARATKP